MTTSTESTSRNGCSALGTGLKRRGRLLRDKVRWRLRRIRASKVRPSTAPFPTPAAFDRWLTRGPTARWSGFPTEWCTVEGLRIEEPAKVAVVLHAYYPDLLDEVVERLANIPVPFDLIVTNATGRPLRLRTAGLDNLAHSLVLDMDNHGRDIYPLVALVNADVLAPYRLILKVHTKRSAWRADHALPGSGDTWRAELIDSLLPPREQLADLLAVLGENPDIGVVTAPGSVLDETAWGDNQPIARELLRRLEMDLPDGFHFAAGSMYWVRGFIVQGLRSLNLTQEDFEPESGQVNLTTAHAIERLIGILAEEAGQSVLAVDGLPAPESQDSVSALGPDTVAQPRARVVPFFLPQFHAVDQNDLWWGPGFTEWTNVTAAKPVFHGQWQPKLPRELGFYDLDDPRALAKHEALAAAAGVDGFMFYHYWFSGERILETPLLSRLDRSGGLPFCIMWANENWTRRWDGRSTDVLLGQDYDAHPPERFVQSVIPELQHPDYLTIDGRQVLAVYRPAQIPRIGRVVDAWRQTAASNGLALYLLAVDVPGAFDGLDGQAAEFGFDGVMGFAPHNIKWSWVDPAAVGAAPWFAGNILDYRRLVDHALRKADAPHPGRFFPGVMTGFDNTARRATTPDLWYGSNPYTFRRWLAGAVAAVSARPHDERVVFVNAWNEWAEGAMLEPSDKFGLTYLQAVRDVLL